MKLKNKKKSKKKKTLKKRSLYVLEKEKNEIKNISPSNLAKIMIALGLIFLIISFHFSFGEIKKRSIKNNKFNKHSEKDFNNTNNNISNSYLFEQIHKSDIKL